MPENSFDEIHAYIAELRDRARKSQAESHDVLDPLYLERDRKPPGDFVESSFLYMRSCDADNGSRPFPCPVFWLSPDLRVAPLSNLTAPTRELVAGGTYRFTAVVRNRGDLIVPSAKVEFWLVTPTLGFDTRFAAKIGVAADRVMAFSATEVSVDYTVPPTVSGHRCLFARVFSFAPLDIPVDDFALNPVIDRHVAQQNLDIVAASESFVLDWVHHRNAMEAFEIVPMDAASLRMVRRMEMVPGTLTTRPADGWTEAINKIGIDFSRPEAAGVETDVSRTETGLQLVSKDPEAVAIERQGALTKQVQSLIATLEAGRPLDGDARKLFAEYRVMTGQTVRSQIKLAIPDFGLKPGRGLPLNVVRRDMTTGEITGGVALIIVSPPGGGWNPR
jgi:hypothetical protein